MMKTSSHCLRISLLRCLVKNVVDHSCPIFNALVSTDIDDSFDTRVEDQKGEVSDDEFTFEDVSVLIYTAYYSGVGGPVFASFPLSITAGGYDPIL